MFFPVPHHFLHFVGRRILSPTLPAARCNVLSQLIPNLYCYSIWPRGCCCRQPRLSELVGAAVATVDPPAGSARGVFRPVPRRPTVPPVAPREPQVRDCPDLLNTHSVPLIMELAREVKAGRVALSLDQQVSLMAFWAVHVEHMLLANRYKVVLEGLMRSGEFIESRHKLQVMVEHEGHLIFWRWCGNPKHCPFPPKGRCVECFKRRTG